MVDYAINLTNKCNWDCSYCISDTHNAKERPIDIVLAEMSQIKKGSTFSLCGGEPGMLSEEDMDKVFDKARERDLLPLDVLTNGLFLKKHSKHLKDVESIHYHCAESLKDDIFEYDIPSHISMDYTVIISGSEYKLLDAFMERHMHLFKGKYEKISLIPAILYDELSKINYIRVMSKYKHLLSERSKECYFKADCEQTDGFKN